MISPMCTSLLLFAVVVVVVVWGAEKPFVKDRYKRLQASVFTVSTNKLLHILQLNVLKKGKKKKKKRKNLF